MQGPAAILSEIRRALRALIRTALPAVMAVTTTVEGYPGF
jgi:hypothetical protein